MPNMFGGDQHHPAYNPTTKVGDHQDLVGNTLWTAEKRRGQWVFLAEEVDGSRWESWDPPSDKLRQYIQEH